MFSVPCESFFKEVDWYDVSMINSTVIKKNISYSWVREIMTLYLWNFSYLIEIFVFGLNFEKLH